MRLGKWSYLAAAVMLITMRASVFAESEGTLTVKTDPDGIEVWLDDKYIGDSPVMAKKLKAGRYSLKLVDPVQKTSTVEDVLIQANEETLIEKTVKSRYGSLKLNSDPEGADVYILTSLGKTPVSNDFIIPGKYRLEVRHQNKSYDKVVEDVTVAKGETVTLNKTLPKINALDGKALLRLALGAGAIGALVFTAVEGFDKNSKSQGNGSQNGQIIGIVAGSLCVIGFEIVAFF
ncbi:MAG TPA: PEGA domain-containing protein [Chitinivibrionales bacterium]|nr:PEGA domain-containing protein [Chitinivibrionales bacterium]